MIENKYIYKITNKINGKIYIGQTINIFERWRKHIQGDGKQNSKIHLAIKNEGVSNFTIEELYYGPDYNTKEKEYIKLYDSQNETFGYNINPGGDYKHTVALK